MGDIVNKVQQSGIVQLELEDLMMDFVDVNMEEYMVEGLFMERPFRQACAAIDAAMVAAKAVYVYSSDEVIVPSWAWMLICQCMLDKGAAVVAVQDAHEAMQTKLYASIAQWDVSPYEDKRVMIKGCGPWAADYKAFALVTQRLAPVVRSLMFGEPCSAVPVYKKRS